MQIREFWKVALVTTIFGLTALGAPVVKGACQESEQQQLAEPLVGIVQGDIPIILSAPHGGKRDVVGAKVRQGIGLERKPGGFVTARDSGTEELIALVAQEVEKRFGKKPYQVVSRAHRKFLDPNREPELAYEEEVTKQIYDSYHNALHQACTEVREKFHSGLLIDLHGQGSAKDTVYRGTQNGLTVKLLKDRFGESAVVGEESLLAMLKRRGWKVHPDPMDGKEQAGFTGGYIVRHYGSHDVYAIDAVQLELGGNYRSETGRSKAAQVLADAVGEYAERYLKITLPESQSQSVATSMELFTQEQRIDVAVYMGDGASASRESLVRQLASEPKWRLHNITAEQIRSGGLDGIEVLIQPGGSGGGQGKALGEEGREKIRRFVANGGGYVGVCAGAYLATCDYQWSLGILDAKVVDRAHWARGFGDVQVALSESAGEILGEEKKEAKIYYHQGPLLAPADNPAIADYEELAEFSTEIAKNGAPSGVMVGTTAIARSGFERGRVICFSPHPEKNDDTGVWLRRAVSWAAGEK